MNHPAEDSIKRVEARIAGELTRLCSPGHRGNNVVPPPPYLRRHFARRLPEYDV